MNRNGTDPTDKKNTEKQEPGKRKNEQGFTLIEIMIALVIFSIGLLGIAIMQINAINGNASARMSTEAATHAQDQIERLLGLPYTHADLSDGVHAATPLPGNIYDVGWVVDEGNPFANAKTVTLTVTKMTATLNRAKNVQIQFVKPQVF